VKAFKRFFLITALVFLVYIALPYINFLLIFDLAQGSLGAVVFDNRINFLIAVFLAFVIFLILGWTKYSSTSIISVFVFSVLVVNLLYLSMWQLTKIEIELVESIEHTSCFTPEGRSQCGYSQRDSDRREYRVTSRIPIDAAVNLYDTRGAKIVFYSSETFPNVVLEKPTSPEPHKIERIYTIDLENCRIIEDENLCYYRYLDNEGFYIFYFDPQKRVLPGYSEINFEKSRELRLWVRDNQDLVVKSRLHPL